MDLASVVWVIDRAIGVEMGVGRQQGLPQGHFYYFRAKEEKMKENLPQIIWFTHIMSGFPNVPNSVGNLVSYQRMIMSFLTNGLFRSFMTTAVTKPDKYTRTFQSFVQLIFKVWGAEVTANNLTEKSQGAMLESQGGLNWTEDVEDVIQGCGSTLWSGLSSEGWFSQSSWRWWLTFGAWVTHSCFSLNTETITESHSTPATDTPSLPVVQQYTDDTQSLSDCLHLSQTFYFQGNSFLSIILSDVSVNNTNGRVGRWCSNYRTFVGLVKVSLISIFHLQPSLCDKQHCIMLFAFVRGN